MFKLFTNNRENSFVRLNNRKFRYFRTIMILSGGAYKKKKKKKGTVDQLSPTVKKRESRMSSSIRLLYTFYFSYRRNGLHTGVSLLLCTAIQR
jgi:hypothetical protein